MNYNQLIDRLKSWYISELPDRLTTKDKIRVIAINSFGIIMVVVCLVYSALFSYRSDTYMFRVALAIAAICSVPVILNILKHFKVSRLLYVFQAPIFVLVFSHVLGKDLFVQYFFLLLFSFPLIFFKPKEIRYSFLFFLYNIACLIYFEFDGPFYGIPKANIDAEIFFGLKISIFCLLLFFTCIIFLVFHLVIINDEEILVRTRYEKEKANQVKQEFLATMSHEMRTPLNAVVTISNILEENPEHKDRHAFIQLLKQSSNNLLAIINDILDFSRLEANKMKLTLRVNDLKKCVVDILDTYRAQADNKGLKIHLDFDGKLSTYYKFDEVKLSQVLGNLISNAIKFTESGHVNIIVRKEDSEGVSDTIYFEVSDSGKGISMNELDKIFEGFTQLRSVLTRESGGTGLGLAIVKRLLKIQESDIIVESAPGKGSTFSFKLQLKPVGSPVAKKKKEFDNKRLLLVEDNTINAIVATKLLENWGLNVAKAENGQIAMKKCAVEKFDFILMDLHMPVMDGFSAARELRHTENPNRLTHIYALTADVMGEDHESFDRYFDGFLAKPINKDQLHNVLQKTFAKLEEKGV